MYHKAVSRRLLWLLRHGLRVCELEVRSRLLEVADDRLIDSALAKHRIEDAQRLDRKLHLVEITSLRRDAAKADRCSCRERVQEDVGDTDLVERLAELLLRRQLPLVSHRSPRPPRPARRRSPPARHRPRTARSDARPRFGRAPPGRARLRSPRPRAVPTRSALRAAVAPESPRRGRSL